MRAQPGWPCVLACLLGCSARPARPADDAAALADGKLDLEILSPPSDITSRDGPAVDAAVADVPAPVPVSWPACPAMVNPGDSCAQSQDNTGCAELGFICRCGCQCASGQGGPPTCTPPCNYRCEFFDWERFFEADPPTVHIDCSKPERVVEVSADVRFQGPPEAQLSVELGRFSLELGLARGSRPCFVNGPITPSSVGPIAAGSSMAFKATARGTCQSAPTLEDPCASCGRTATAVLQMQVKSGPLTAQWTGRGVGRQPRGAPVIVTCTSAP